MKKYLKQNYDKIHTIVFYALLLAGPLLCLITILGVIYNSYMWVYIAMITIGLIGIILYTLGYYLFQKYWNEEMSERYRRMNEKVKVF